MVSRAYDIAASILDRTTLDHSDRMAVWLGRNGADDARLATAWLHDVLEVEYETDLSYFPAEVVNAVLILTRLEEEKEYHRYINDIKLAKGIARDVKIADLLDNLYGRPDPPQDSLAERYHTALRTLWRER